MSYESEYILDRRKLKRRLTLWQIIAVGVALFGFFSLVALDKDLAANLGVADQIARIEISGVILEDETRAKMLKQIANNASVKAVVVRFNSPGGTTTGGEALYTNLRAIAQVKPVVAVFGTMATSAAYMAGVAAEHIVARGNTITGSVGVIMQWAEVSQMLGKLGISMNEMKSGSLKAVPSPFQPLDEPGRKLTQDMIDESHRWFVDLVVGRRNIEPSSIPGFMEGRIFSGRQALSYKLIDKIGGEEQALEWLRDEKEISSGLPIINWKSDEVETTGMFSSARIFIAGLLGFDIKPMMEQMKLNGLVSSPKMGVMNSKWRQP